MARLFDEVRCFVLILVRNFFSLHWKEVGLAPSKMLRQALMGVKCTQHSGQLLRRTRHAAHPGRGW